jgi:undecaprenyl pyrophosphate synthase
VSRSRLTPPLSGLKPLRMPRKLKFSRSSLDDVLEGYTGPVPRHIAVIMDGNGRWAQLRGEERTAGHRAGAKTVRAITRACAKLGVEVLTLYSFSTENWGRPKIEVDALMALLTDYLENEADELLANRIRLRAIGELDSLPAGVRMLLDQVGHFVRARGCRNSESLGYRRSDGE